MGDLGFMRMTEDKDFSFIQRRQRTGMEVVNHMDASTTHSERRRLGKWPCGSGMVGISAYGRNRGKRLKLVQDLLAADIPGMHYRIDTFEQIKNRAIEVTVRVGYEPDYMQSWYLRATAPAHA